mmetsp:Transcript_27065/g.89887  ORF Transcript_27065/g.89887 Transcript_27065/m.89887 type:complete len:253 (-) Transcript_27065:472-1230(-)
MAGDELCFLLFKHKCLAEGHGLHVAVDARRSKHSESASEVGVRHTFGALGRCSCEPKGRWTAGLIAGSQPCAVGRCGVGCGATLSAAPRRVAQQLAHDLGQGGAAMGPDTGVGVVVVAGLERQVCPRRLRPEFVLGHPLVLRLRRWAEGAEEHADHWKLEEAPDYQALAPAGALCEDGRHVLARSAAGAASGGSLPHGQAHSSRGRTPKRLPGCVERAANVGPLRATHRSSGRAAGGGGHSACRPATARACA